MSRVNRENIDLITISKDEYEELVRNSENLRDIERVTRNSKYDPDRVLILALCGYEEMEERDHVPNNR